MTTLGRTLVDAAAHALRHALRGLFRRPGPAAALVLILALGIGVSTGVFSVARQLLLRPIPVSEPGRLVVAWETDPAHAGSLVEVSLPYFLEWRGQSRSFEDLSAFGSVNWSYGFQGPPRRETVAAAYVSASFFDTLRARPLLGRGFQAQDDDPGAERTLVISHALWQRRFGGDPAVVGRSVARSDPPATIVGVMPREFDFPRGAELWVPVGPELDAVRRRGSMAPEAFRSLGVLYVTGRLRRGVSMESAQTELAGISRHLSLADGFSAQGWSAKVVPLVDHHLGASARRALETLSAASATVLLLACLNAAVLVLVQAMTRRTDLAVRRALGAGAARAALPQIAEAALLAAVGGVLGALLAAWGVRVAVALGADHLPALRDAAVDGSALGFALCITLAAALLVALIPAALASRLAIAPALKAGSRGGGLDRRGWNLTRLLVTSEVALSIVLLVGSGLLVRSLEKLLRVDLGFVPEGAFSFTVDLAAEKYPTDSRRRAFHRAFLEGLAALPGVEAAGAVHNRPLEHGPIGSDHWVTLEGQPLDRASLTANSISVNWETATPGYFRAVGTRLLAGRAFTEHDTPEAPAVVIVSEGLARRCWPGQDPLGKRLVTGGAKVDMSEAGLVVHEWQTVVGVVEDARYRGIQNPRFDVFLPYSQGTASLSHVVVRTAGEPPALVPAVREQLRTLDPDAILDGFTPMTRLVERALAPWRFASALLGAFALSGLILTASGLFAVLHRFVAGRTREIAIRMALGAEPRRVRSFVLGQGLAMAALGSALGFALSLVLARSLSALLYEVQDRDPWSYLAAGALIVLVAAAASLLPARRAAAVDPIVALRSE
jgi:putative ABC transport system permease protein